MLTERTERDYRRFAKRWERDARDPWPGGDAVVAVDASERSCRAVWYHRVELGRALAIPHVPQVRRVPKALSDEELACVRAMALGVHPRCRPVLEQYPAVERFRASEF